MIYFQKVNNNNTIRSLSKTAIDIFKDHYTPILGEAQVDYMIGLFHTPSAIKKQMRNGASYYLVFDNFAPCGFFSIEKHGSRIFLSKLYLNKDYRGQRTGTRMLNKVIELSDNETAIYLTVNKHNDASYGFYMHEGFTQIGECVTDIGNGFKMDDYILERKIVRDIPTLSKDGKEKSPK